MSLDFLNNIMSEKEAPINSNSTNSTNVNTYEVNPDLESSNQSKNVDLFEDALRSQSVNNNSSFGNNIKDSSVGNDSDNYLQNINKSIIEKMKINFFSQNDQKVMENFLNIMQDQYNISPLDFIAAISLLDGEKLSLPASKTIDDVINNLSLDMNAKSKVKKIYQNLISQISPKQKNKSDNANFLNGGLMALTMGTFPPLAGNSEKIIINQQEGNNSLLKNSLNNSHLQPELVDSNIIGQKTKNSDFFSKNNINGSILSEKNEIIENEKNNFFNNIKDSSSKGQMFNDIKQKIAQLESNLDSNVDRSTKNNLNFDTNVQNKQISGFNDSKLANELDNLDESSFNNSLLFKSFSQKNNTNSQSQDNFLDFNNENNSTKLFNDKKSTKEQITENLESDKFNFLGINQKNQNSRVNTSLMSSGIAANTLSNSNNEVIQDMINQVRFLNHQGGGEARIKLNGDMGNIDLQVKINNGNVSVYMNVDNFDVKNLLDSKIHELKNNLINHKLNIENILVDVAGKTQNNFHSQNNNDNENFKEENFHSSYNQNQNDSNGFNQKNSNTFNEEKLYADSIDNLNIKEEKSRLKVEDDKNKNNENKNEMINSKGKIHVVA